MTCKRIKDTIAEGTKRPACDQIHCQLPDRFGGMCKPTQEDKEPELICIPRQISKGEVHHKPRQEVEKPRKWIATLQKWQSGRERCTYAGQCARSAETRRDATEDQQRHPFDSVMSRQPEGE